VFLLLSFFCFTALQGITWGIFYTVWGVVFFFMVYLLPSWMRQADGRETGGKEAGLPMAKETLRV
jgi:hypothetical protein